MFLLAKKGQFWLNQDVLCGAFGWHRGMCLSKSWHTHTHTLPVGGITGWHGVTSNMWQLTITVKSQIYRDPQLLGAHGRSLHFFSNRPPRPTHTHTHKHRHAECVRHTQAHAPTEYFLFHVCFSGKFRCVSAQSCERRARSVVNVNLVISCFVWAGDGWWRSSKCSTHSQCVWVGRGQWWGGVCWSSSVMQMTPDQVIFLQENWTKIPWRSESKKRLMPIEGIKMSLIHSNPPPPPTPPCLLLLVTLRLTPQTGMVAKCHRGH